MTRHLCDAAMPDPLSTDLPSEAPSVPEGSDQPAATAAPEPSSPAASAAACAEALKRLFPGLFQGPPKPLKLRIQADIQARAPGQFTKAQLSAFLRRYTGSHGYLQALTRAPHRFDLDGAAAGDISEEHRQAAAQELQRRRQIVAERRAQEDADRDQRARLLRDFERTTLTLPNFLALKGLTAETLESQLAHARTEAAEPPRPRPDARGRPIRDQPRRGHPGRPESTRPEGGPRGPKRGQAGGGRPPR